MQQFTATSIAGVLPTACPAPHPWLNGGLALLLLCGSLQAMAAGQFVDLAPKSKAEIELILQTLETSINASIDTSSNTSSNTSDNKSGDENLPPIVMILHGKEANRYVRGNYDANKALVDQTAKLAAYGILDVKICETWLRDHNYTTRDLFPFVQGVPLGTAEIERLSVEEGYVEHSVSM